MHMKKKRERKEVKRRGREAGNQQNKRCVGKCVMQKMWENEKNKEDSYGMGTMEGMKEDVKYEVEMKDRK